MRRNADKVMKKARPQEAQAQHVIEDRDYRNAELDEAFGAEADEADEAIEPPSHAVPEVRGATVEIANHGQRLDKFLVSIAPEFSRSHLQSLIEGGHALIDGSPEITTSRKLRSGQRLSLTLMPTLESLAFRAEPMALAVVFEDEHLMVVNKPVGLVVHPAAGNWQGTLLNGLLAHHTGAAHLPRAGIVHRLDKDTSGLMVVGKTLEAVTALSRAIAAREVRRRYLALAHGLFSKPEFTVEAPIGRDPVSRIRMAIAVKGKPAKTDFELLAQGTAAAALRCTLHTGRTHQIRVHLAHVGHPLLADTLYGGKPALGMARQALHAASLAFQHPITQARMSFAAPWPADLSQACEVLGIKAAQTF
jgi:23S rRNA pseudouridine1911/1915/1917 synthase